MPTLPMLARLAPREGLRVPLRNACLAGLAAAALSVLLPNQYRSEARILSDTGHAGGGSSLRTGVWAPTAPPETPALREDGPTVIYADILKSRRMAEQLLLRTYEYSYRPWRFARRRQARATLLDYLGAANVDRAMGPLKAVLSVQRDPKSGLLTISAETRSPELSMQVVRRAAENLRDFLVELGQTAGQNKARFTLGRLEEVQARYRDLGRQFEQFQDSNRNWETSPAPNIRFRGQQLKEGLALWKQVVMNLTLNHEQALLEAQNDTQTLLLMDPGNLPLEKSRPSRALIVFAVASAAGAGSWVYRNRTAITNRILAKEHSA
ncbi:MAG: hypothetical protein P4L36_00840 [Holophaga sp.]|nr:hypothetical protein [Holophaga sp.]